MGKGGYFILGQKIRKHARYYIRVFREKMTFGWGKSRKRARYYKRFFTGNYFNLGQKFENMLDILGGFERKIVFQGKSRKCARYYERVLREKLTFRPKLQFVA